ncbi:MAG: hypothetical protein HY901_16095 [Deltaproteobacteria bacterium]|nr:hypothetical protein [Deltaproteobacteria bacterium]
MAETRDNHDAPSGPPRRTRRAYSPPRIEQIEIVPGEAMLGACKVSPTSQGGMTVCGAGCPGTGS